MESDFPRLVSLACHDLRTPLATVQGFAKTLLDRGEVEGQAVRWLQLIDEASDELVDLLEQLSVAARIEDGRYAPIAREADSLELARAALPDAAGEGATVLVDPDAAVRSLAALQRAASRHGGVEVAARVDGGVVELAPLVAGAAPIVLGEELKDLGAAVAVRVLRTLGGDVEADGERLLVRLPEPAGA